MAHSSDIQRLLSTCPMSARWHTDRGTLAHPQDAQSTARAGEVTGATLEPTEEAHHHPRAEKAVVAMEGGGAFCGKR